MTIEVNKGDRVGLEDMNNPVECSHEWVYIGPNGWWYCAKCPAYDDNKEVFHGNKATTGPKY